MRTSVDIVNPMDMNMFLKSMDLIKRLTTNWAIIGKHLCCMDFQVTGQSRIAKETFATFWARQWFTFIRAMDSHMFLKKKKILDL